MHQQATTVATAVPQQTTAVAVAAAVRAIKRTYNAGLAWNGDTTATNAQIMQTAWM